MFYNINIISTYYYYENTLFCYIMCNVGTLDFTNDFS